MIEDLGAKDQRKAQIEGMRAPTGVIIGGVEDPHGLLGITQHPGRMRHEAQTVCLWVPV
jgi:hypothetical protein